MKRHRLRAMRTALRSLLSDNQVMAIHEPALAGLLECLVTDDFADSFTVAARLGMGSNDPPTTQMIGNVAVLPIFGVLSQKSNWFMRAMGWTATETLERDFKEAAANSQIKAIVFYCDSPGGAALGNEETTRIIFDARKSKPTYTFVRGLCASAAYYLGSAARQVFASPSSTVGSIGAVSTHIEFSKALAEMGIAATVIRSSPHKQLWNQFEKLSGDAKATLQKWVGDYGSQFEQAVARHRGIEQADVKARFGQGDVFLAAEAKQRGLIDGVLSWEQLLAQIQAGPSTLPGTGDDDGSDSQVARKSHDRVVVRGAQLGLATFAGLSVVDGSLTPGWSPELEASYANQSASGSPATASAAVEASSQLPAAPPVAGQSATPPEKSTVKISARVRAALFARGFISAQDADGAICLAALGAYFAARGEACPQNSEKTELDDDKVVAALFAVTPAATATPATPATPPANQPSNVQTAHDREVAEARQQAANDTLARTKEIRAGGKVLGMTQEQIDAAVDSGKPYAEIAAGWTRELAAKETPITPRTDIKVGEEGINRYVADATLATLLHYNRGVPQAQVTPQIQQLAHAPLIVHAEQCLRAANVRFDPYDREAMMTAAFEMDGAGRQVIKADGGIAYNRPGSFPNLLSNLANKVLDEGPQNADTSFEAYTGLWPGDLPDFKPAPVVAKGRVGELDEVLDAEEFKEQGLAEECQSFLQLSRFGNKVGLTPVLAANDDLGAFLEDLLGLSEGWELTQNRGCLRLVTGNVALLDSFNLYDDTNHANHVSSGGNPPGDAEWDKMQIKMSNQTTIGAKARARLRLSIILCPVALERGALQAFLPFRDVGETKQAATDSNMNVYRGRVTVVSEPDLADASAVEWYGFADPRRFGNAAIVRAYFRGWGRKGKRERWYDPNTKCYWVSLEGRFGAAAKQYRATVKNKGAA